jgi:hypothetical protein
MKRYIVALLIAGGAFVTAPRSSEAGVIPWTYNAIFGPGPVFGWRQAYYSGYAPYYSTGYAPFYGYRARYSASYAYGVPYYGGMNNSGCCGVANYTPDWGSGCCAPVNPCCGTCVSGCDSGCVGGACTGCGVDPSAAATSGTGGSEPTPADSSGRKSPETYAPETRQPTTPNDDFGAGNRSLNDRNRGRGTEGFGGDGTGGLNNNKSEAPPFQQPAPADPKGDPDARVMPPVEPVNLDAKVAYRAPSNFKRVHATAKFRLPAVVRVTPSNLEQTPAAVASK